MSARWLLAVAVAVAVGTAGGIAYERLGTGGAPPSGKKIAYWVAPMDPNYRRDAPGKSPMGMDLIPVYEGEEPGARKAGDDAQVTLSPAVVNTIGVRTGTAEPADFSADIRTVGYVAQNEDRTSHVHVRKDGWIEQLVVRSLGTEVRKGDLLFEYFSQELAATSTEYVRDLERGNAGMSSGGAYKLRALGVSESQIQEIASSRRPAHRFRIHAPQDGVVVQLGVGEGMYIRPDQTIMTLSDLSSIWVIADVLESQSDRVFPGMEAEARLAHLPQEVWRGRVDYVYPELDETTRTLRVRLRFANPGMKLRPRMFAEITLKGKPRKPVLAVPSEAVIRTGRSDRVVQALGDGRFRSVAVKVGAQHQDRTEILEGLDQGARVVLSSQFLIDSEASLKAGFARMENDGHTPQAAEDLVTAEATVNSVNAGARTLNVTHGPIPALGWPGMTMDFALAEGLAMPDLAPGAKVRLDLGKDADGMVQVVKVEAVQ
ncbi:efflux RND transporter periplasmic adaptor subunit [Magnetospirillum sp. UT-4]|uniref:efflux RND transporter periplasmic adaptor subunit n=1 Tax=Magnetospirillum sp. UT-4 TaxID=2681467 RepID=UPI0013806369|nr:efflux RND transporter periplasmic adaptor subunit [Magnetospirillum sp. UT-4]CAA7614952.1 Cobalt/zinc/cadmium efflux RND transporter [Magnetospirillum sp. UT-4]